MRWILAGPVCTACYGIGRFFYMTVSEFWQPLIMFWAGTAYMLLWTAVIDRLR